jgi:hypothetical protein
MDRTVVSDSVALDNDRISLRVARAFGPRILSLNYEGGANLMAELPDYVTRRPDGKTYRFYGGHRLWLAPEDPIRSYALDDQEVDITRTSRGLLVRKPVEQESEIEKSMSITLADGDARLTIAHCLTNRGPVPVRCAPWAITQFRTGGVAILPQGRPATELLPNRVLALWPYTDMDSSHVSWGKRFILVRAMNQPPFKVGFPNSRGWLGHWLDGTLFVKRVAFEAQAEYCDLGSSSECYCNHRFLELETLGPMGTLAPGESAVHTEVWELYGNVERPKDEDTTQTILDEIGLE